MAFHHRMKRVLATLLNEYKRVNNYSKLCIQMDGEWAGGWISHPVSVGGGGAHARVHTLSMLSTLFTQMQMN